MMFYIKRWAILFLLAVLFLIIYYLIYTRKINQRVCKGDVKGRKMPDFPDTVITVVIVLLLSVCIVDMNIPAAAPVSRDNFAVIDTSDYSYQAYSSEEPLDDASFARLFSEDENAGYEKEEFQDGDFQFTVFTAAGAPSDSFHPDFLCYVSYTGKTAAALSFNGEFSTSDVSSHINSSSVFDYIGQTILIIGNYDKVSRFLLKVGAYDEQGVERLLNSPDTAETMETFALSSGSVLINQH